MICTLFFHEIHGIVKSNSQIKIHNFWLLNLFYKWTGNFKNIDKILDSAYEWYLDKQVIMNAIEYALEVKINRRKKNKEFLQNRQISSKLYLSYDKSICSKIAYLNKKLEEFKRLMEIPIMNCNLDEETQDKRR